MVIDSMLTSAATNYSPLLGTVGIGGLAGFLIGFVIKKLFKILAIVAGVFFAVLIYLEQQGMVNMNWDKINATYHSVLSTVTNTITNSTTGGIGGSHTTTAATSLLPTMTNLGIPLTGSTALGFVIGIMKG
ncbi:MAG: FUN14 domain-containing protein [Nitrososphaeraceae archaeon]